MTDLEEITGIGPSYAEELVSLGYENAEEVANADPSEIDDVVDIRSGEQLIESAQEVSDPVEEEDETVDKEYVTFDPDLDEDQRNHLIAGLVDEEIKMRRTNRKDDSDSIKEVIEMVINDEEMELDMYQVGACYRACNQLESTYRSQRGIGSFVTKIRNMGDLFEEQRQKLTG